MACFFFSVTRAYYIIYDHVQGDRCMLLTKRLKSHELVILEPCWKGHWSSESGWAIKEVGDTWTERDYRVNSATKSLLKRAFSTSYVKLSVVVRLTKLQFRVKESHLPVMCGIHSMLPVTRHKWTHPALTPAIQAGTRFTYPGETRKLSYRKGGRAMRRIIVTKWTKIYEI